MMRINIYQVNLMVIMSMKIMRKLLKKKNYNNININKQLHMNKLKKIIKMKMIKIFKNLKI